MYIISTLLIFVLIISVLIFVHELGHFLAAKIAKMKVEEFSIGFKPAIFEKKIGETNYILGSIPIGGYVKIFGENPGSEMERAKLIKDKNKREKRIKEIEDSKGRGFHDKNRFWQGIVLSMGVIFNFIFAYLIFLFIVFSNPNVRLNDIPDNDQKYLVEKKLIITDIQDNSLAKKSGLKEKESEIYSMKIDGKNQDILDKNIYEKINNSKKSIEISYYPNKILTDKQKISPINGALLVEKKTIKIPVVYDKNGERKKFGIYFLQKAKIDLPFFKKFEYAWKSFWVFFQEIFESLKGLFNGQVKIDDLSGPVGIAKVSGEAFQYGGNAILMLLAMLSINLGIINILPFPALDGGRLFIVILEGIFRKKMPEKIFNMINFFGFLALMILMIYITYQDILKI